VGDSGELVTAVYLLGIPHPTGSPLYVLLGKLWTLALPLGSVAWRMSLFSTVCAAAACGLLYRLCRRMPLDPVAAGFAALLFAFSPSFWGEANVQRVYGLGAVFVVLATAAAWRWHERRSGASLAWAFFLCGLGATAHVFMAVYAIALAIFVTVHEPAIFRHPRRLAAAGGAFLAGSLPQLYLPLRSRANPPLDWGNPETLQGFLDVVSRRDFWHRAWLEGPADVPVILGDYLLSLATELAWAGAALALVGIVVGRRRRWPVLLSLLVMAANVAAMAVHGSRSDLFIWHRYYIPSYAMAALLAGIGCQALLERLPRALSVLPLAIPIYLLVSGWAAFDRSRYRIAEDFSLAVLRSLPPGAHLAATDDNILFVLMYLHLVEERRPDVDLILQGVGNPSLPPLRFNPDTEPLFFTHHPNWNLPALESVPVGLVFRAVRREQPLAPLAVAVTELDGEHDPNVPKDYLTQNLIGHFHYMLGSTFEDRDWPRARREFQAAAAASPDNDVLFYNLGLIFRRDGLLDEAAAAFGRSHAINPRHLASAGRPRAADRLAEVMVEQGRLAAIERSLAADGSLQTITPDTPAYHRRLAELLVARGEPLAARGHRLRALEIEP
jgi:tetratricopeptide (TPR) repeat protein